MWNKSSDTFHLLTQPNNSRENYPSDGSPLSGMIHYPRPFQMWTMNSLFASVSMYMTIFLIHKGFQTFLVVYLGGQFMKVVSLLLLTPQYAILILTMRYVCTRPGPMFVTSTTVFLAEVVKTVACLLFILVQERSIKGWARHLYDNLICRPRDFALVCVPSLLFVVQNNLVFVAISNLDAATFQVTYQLKILTTAMFSVMLLGKRLSYTQWIALLLLFLGVSVIQAEQSRSSVPKKSTPVIENIRVRGIAAVVACCCLSGFANVFFEKLMKDGKQSVWLRNIQLGTSGSVLGALAVWINDGSKLRAQGFFYGFDWVVWTVVGMQAFGGLLVAAVIKYADNILKGFSTAGSILISCLASVYIFEFKVTQEFVIGTTLVMVAVYLYSAFPAPLPAIEIEVKPEELLENQVATELKASKQAKVIVIAPRASLIPIHK